MKKILNCLVLLMTTFSAVTAGYSYPINNGYNYGDVQCVENNTCGFDWCGFWHDGWSIEGRAGAFIPFSNRYRQIYGDVAPEIQIQINKEINCDWSVWANVGYQWDTGHSIGLENRTRIEVVPISLGFKYFYPIQNWKPYVGLGVVYSLLEIHDHSSFVPRRVTKNEFGGVVKLGVNYDISNDFYLDIFGDYRFQEFTFHSSSNATVTRHTADLNGFTVGAGIGWKL